jgi:hypothetical protein
MPFIASCPCGRQSHVPDGARGALVWCPACSSFYLVPTKKPRTTVIRRTPAKAQSPFLTACTFCGHESHVPGCALGTTAWCPSCWNSYTVVKKQRSDLAVPALARGPAIQPAESPPPTGPASPPTPAAQPLLPAALVGTAVATATVPAEPALPPAPIAAPLPIPRAQAQTEDDEVRDIDPVGAGALFLGCAALLCASVSWLCALLAPLSLVALVAGGISLFRSLRFGRSRPLFPIAGTAVPAVLLVVAVLMPGLLGPHYRAYKDQDPIDPAEIRRNPLPSRNDGKPVGDY